MADPFRRFRVARKTPESSVITSFHLAPADGGPLWTARPGQYLTLRVPAEGGSLLRTYSLSCAVDAPDCHRITVKRESLGSVWLHDVVAEGDEIEIAAPRGGFHLDEDSTRPVLLLAGGVGLTPLLSMLHRLAATDRRVFFVHACENGDVQAMRDEVAAIAAASAGRITARHVYRTPTEADRAKARFDAEGVVDRGFLQSLLPQDDYEVYLCGPTPFMVAMWRLLTGLGIAPGRIAYEFFGKGGSLAALAEAEAAAEAAVPPAPAHVPAHAPRALAGLEHLTDPEARAVPDAPPRRATAASPAAAAAPVAAAAPASATAAPVAAAGDEVIFARSGVSATWHDAAGSLLELAEAAGLNPDFSCREGICNTCRCAIREGVVEYTSEPLDPPPPGQVLICCSRPVGRVVLDI